MTRTRWTDRMFIMPALIIGADESDPDATAAGYGRFQLCNRNATWTAVAWPSVHLPAGDSWVPLVQATVLDVRGDDLSDPIALVHWEPLASTTILDLIPDAFCPIAGTVRQSCALIKTIESDVIRRLLAEVLRRSDVHARYWTCPASLRHHHAGAGGLARHCLEVAVAVDSVRALDRWQKDIAVAYAFLHDLGKLWCYESGVYAPPVSGETHEAVGYRELGPTLQRLAAQDHLTIGVLDTLLSGVWKRDWRDPAAPMGDIVRAMDRFSAARAVGNVAEEIRF